MMRCASAASVMGSSVSMTGRITPDSTTGQTSSATADVTVLPALDPNQFLEPLATFGARSQTPGFTVTPQGYQAYEDMYVEK